MATILQPILDYLSSPLHVRIHDIGPQHSGVINFENHVVPCLALKYLKIFSVHDATLKVQWQSAVTPRLYHDHLFSLYSLQSYRQKRLTYLRHSNRLLELVSLVPVY